MAGRGRPKGPKPGLRSRWLGEKLRAMREAAGKSRSDTAEFLQRDPTVVSRQETGEYPVRRADVYALLTYYNVEDEGTREALLTLCEDVWRKSWWDPYSDEVTRDFIDLPWLESRTQQIEEYQTMVLHGMLQTRAYADAVITKAEHNSSSDQQIARWVDLRLERQKVLSGDSIRYFAVLEEPVLRRPIGGPKVMREQLEHLLEAGERDNIDLRIMPTSHGPHSGHLGSFMLFTMPEEFTNVAYVESLGGALYVESPGVERFEDAWDDLFRGALSPKHSAALIKTVLEEMK